jgi:RNA polymerase sigma-70 factor (ECF subfamily)
MMPDSDQSSMEARIVLQAIEGDKQAFGQLYEMYADRIFRYLVFRMGSMEAAEDLMCEVFLKAWTALPDFGAGSNDRNFKSWLYRIAHNALIDHRRTLKDEISLENLAEIQSKNEKPDKIFESKEQSSQLARMLNLLDELSRDVLIHRFVAGLSHRETASILGINEGHVRVIQYRAIKRMRRMTGE